MTDDIVTRLRESAKYVETDGNRWAADDCREAANEIERLQKSETAWRELAEFMYPFVVDVDMRSIVAESIEEMMIAVREATGKFTND